ncbi:MAG: ribosome small subunit-dependent GTPase A [Chitinispirillia bacterium]|nr:ribosome small subunit-dependent GTPase A [Chitinispirillia bacterium]MCL2242280.1 ribosome small subunit-dependent GTPase A [Chitinispirillia bacterium]
MLAGRVVEEQKNYYIVSTARKDVRCTLKGALLKKKKQRLCTGDAVSVQIINDDSAEGIICSISPRRNLLPRPPLANLDQVIFVNCFKHPSLDTEAIDRFLFSSMSYDVESVIVFNKMDLLDDEEFGELEDIERFYKNIGYQILHTSVQDVSGIDKLIDLCKDKTSAFTGLSGVGKSSLLSLIFPGMEFRTSEVSGARGRGTHTTTHTKLLSLDKNTFIADTPGFAFVDVPTVDEGTVIAHFPEIEAVTGQCKFNNCIHDAEPGCRVIELIEAGEIAPWRHEHYLKIYGEMVRRRKMY